MAHFAEIDENSLVIRVLVTDNHFPNEGHDWLIDNLGGTWVQTSYNANFRKNFAGIGFSYDQTQDAFVPPKPYSNWLLNEETCQWEAPIPYPTDGIIYSWNEELGDWEAVIYDNETTE